MNQYSEDYWDNQIKIKAVEGEQIVVGSSDCKGVVIRKSIEEKATYVAKEENKNKPASIESSSSKKKNGKKKILLFRNGNKGQYYLFLYRPTFTKHSTLFSIALYITDLIGFLRR